MSYSISYQERAIKEFESAIEWYRQRSERAATNFEIAVKEKIDLLRSDPSGYKRTYKQFREVLVKKYPYRIIYLVDQQENRVVISSIFHHKRNPRKKYKKV